MSGFPPKKWHVRTLKDMDTMEGTSGESDDISMEALMAIKPAEGEEGAFRFVLAGPDKVKLHFPISDILQDFIFSEMYIKAEMHIGQQILMEKNSVCSKWMDLVDLVNSQDVEVVDKNGADVSETFMEAMDNYKKIALPHLSGNKKSINENV